MELAAPQAKASGVNLNQYVVAVLASRFGAQAEVERSFAVRAARAVPGRAEAILARAGQGNPPCPGDELDGNARTAATSHQAGRPQ